MVFTFDWVVREELAIGKSPKSFSDIKVLQDNNVQSILSLCSNEEGQIFSQIKDFFNYKQFVLPDHKTKKDPALEEIQLVINHIENLMEKKPVYVHCVASIERSPLICMAWLVKTQFINPIEALEYLTQVHKETNPLPGQLKILNDYYKSLSIYQ